MRKGRDRVCEKDIIELHTSLNAHAVNVITVPNRRRRILLKVVLVRRWVISVLGIWRGVGWEEG